MAEAFVYRWRHARSREWYIGYHRGTADDGYVCSSKTARPRITTETGWTRRILRWGTKREMIDLERKILTRLDAKNNPRSLNLHNGNGQTGTGRPKGSTNKIKIYTIFQRIREITGRDYMELLAESYWKVVLAGDQPLIKKYHRLFERKWGPLWFEHLGIADQVKKLTDFKSKRDYA